MCVSVFSFKIDLTSRETQSAEKYVSELVSNKSIYARIDRPSNVVSFVAPKNANELLNDWCASSNTIDPGRSLTHTLTNRTSSTDSLLRIVETISHLVGKERMQHGVDEAAQS